MRSLSLAVALLLAGSAAAQTSPILIPIFYNGPGAGGSEWYTNVQITNRSQNDVEGRGMVFLRRGGCPIPEGCHVGHARRGEFSELESPQSLEGLLLHVNAADADRIDVQAQFGEETRHPRLGIELPVARERDFRTTSFGFPLVRTAPGFRTLLRLYSPDPVPGQRVRVVLRPFFLPANSFAASYDLTLFVTDGTALPMRPAFAQLDLGASFGETGLGGVRVDVIPLATGGRTPRVWGFVTITDDATNDVTVMRP